MSVTSEICFSSSQPARLEAALAPLQAMIISLFLSYFSMVLAVSFVITRVYCFSSMGWIASGPGDLHPYKVVLVSLTRQAWVSVLSALL